MTAIRLLQSVASRLDQDARAVRETRWRNWEATARHIERMAKDVREAAALIERADVRAFEFKGKTYMRLPSGKVVKL